MPVTPELETPELETSPNGSGKRFLAMVGAGLAAAVLLVFGIKQCSNKNTAYDERDAARNETEQVATRANAVIDSLNNVNGALDRARRECNSVVGAKDEQIDALNDSIMVLKDSLQNAARQLQKVRKPRRNNTQTRQNVQNKSAGNNAGRPASIDNNNGGTVIVGDNNTVVVSTGTCATVNAAADTLKQHTVTITRQWIGTRRVK